MCGAMEMDGTRQTHPPAYRELLKAWYGGGSDVLLCVPFFLVLSVASAV